MLSIASAQNLWPEDEQRLNVGINLFPACLSADLGMADKLTPEGRLAILVVHKDTPHTAETVVMGLTELRQVGGHPLSVRALSTRQLDALPATPIAAIFVATPGIHGQAFKDWAQRHQALVFSPFAGDVERGAMAGVFVSDRILPLVNDAQARRAGIRFKPFFMRIAKRHE